jgi:agmatine deiminase
VLEGGSVDVDGEGTVLTTSQCLENDNRNPGMSRAQLERAVGAYLGTSRTLWVTDGLLNDHTDGHIDTIARFVRPGVVCCMAPSGSDDPNRHAVLGRIARRAPRYDRRARTHAEPWSSVPSPGRVLDEDGESCPPATPTSTSPTPR